MEATAASLLVVTVRDLVRAATYVRGRLKGMRYDTVQRACAIYTPRPASSSAALSKLCAAAAGGRQQTVPWPVGSPQAGQWPSPHDRAATESSAK